MNRFDLDPKVKTALVEILAEQNPTYSKEKLAKWVDHVLFYGVDSPYWDEMSRAFWAFIAPISHLMMPVIHQMIAAAVPAVIARADEINSRGDERHIGEDDTIDVIVYGEGKGITKTGPDLEED